MDASKNKRVAAIETGGHRVALGKAGATIYDPVLGEELKKKYKGSSDVVIAEKSYVGLGDGTHHWTFKGVDTSKLKPRPTAGQWVKGKDGKEKYIPPTPDKE